MPFVIIIRAELGSVDLFAVWWDVFVIRNADILGFYFIIQTFETFEACFTLKPSHVLDLLPTTKY